MESSPILRGKEKPLKNIGETILRYLDLNVTPSFATVYLAIVT